MRMREYKEGNNDLIAGLEVDVCQISVEVHGFGWQASEYGWTRARYIDHQHIKHEIIEFV